MANCRRTVESSRSYIINMHCEWKLSVLDENDKMMIHVRYQYSETNVMHCLFSLLKIKGLYMFREFLAHPQEALHKRYLVYFVSVMSVGCYQDGVEPLQSWSSQLT
jgi:hypothetical protein